MKGWHNEPHRHALAARGIPTTFNPKGFEKSLHRAGYMSLEEARRAVVQAHMTPEEVLEWKVDATYSASPDTAFGFRDDEIETLYDLGKREDRWFLEEALGVRWQRDWPSTTYWISNIEKGEKITVYRASDVGDIIPGSYVADSKHYVLGHGEFCIRGGQKYDIYSLEAYPDELMWYGDPHEFLFIPRSPERWLEIARERVRDIPLEVQEKLLALGGGP